LALEERVAASSLELETDMVKFRRPVWIKAYITKITNAVTVDVTLDTSICFVCSRCLSEFESVLNKNLRFNYSVSKLEQVIDLDPDIREEIILDYPIKPLCRPDCKGLCPKCGKNLNEEQCAC
jgi:uncharacterized protein